MSAEESHMKRLPTGVPGLDAILEGGLLRGGVYLVHGPPGAGKTILANQIAFRHAADGEQALYVTLLTEAHSRLLGHISRLRFFDSKLVSERLYYVSGFKVLETEGLDGLVRMVRGSVIDRKPSLLVIDGLVSAEESSPSQRDFKKFIHELQTLSAMVGCTVLLLSSTERPVPFHPGYTMVDGIIELADDLVQLRPIRHLRVKKMRGTAQIGGQHAVEITDDGIVVRARLETRATDNLRRDGAVTPGPGRRAFGVPSLDEMLRGGVPTHSVTMLLGGTGTGKTMLGLQFLAEGARRGERSLHFGFYERPEAVLKKSERLGLGLEEAERQGLFRMVWQPQVEVVIDLLGHRLLEAVDRFRPERVFIDGIQGFQLAIDFPERARDAFAALSDDLERRGVTTLYSAETRDLFGPQIASPVSGVSAVTQNVFLMRTIEMRAEVRLLFSIIKVRDSAFDRSIRELRIDDDGIHLRPFDEPGPLLAATSLDPGTGGRAKKAERGIVARIKAGVQGTKRRRR